MLAVVRSLRTRDPFLDVRLFRSGAFSAAALVSLLTGYAFATAIIGGAVFVDRVLYGGPDEQRLALGALAGATAVGALVSGFAVRIASYRVVTLVGLALSIGGLAAMAGWTAATGIRDAAIALAAFGLGFGLSVTPRSTAAVEAAGRAAFGAASSVVTVARMLGMAIGLAVLTAYGSTTIDRLSAEVYATPDAYLALIPEGLRDRPLRDPLVVEALEAWASREAASIMVGLFLVAAVVTLVAVPPALALGGGSGRRRAASEDTGPRPTTRVCWPAMAVQTPASSSDRPTGRAGEPVAGRRRAAPHLGPGTVRIAAVIDGKTQEWEGTTGLARLPELLRLPDAAVWVDLVDPSRRAGRAGRRIARASPAHRRGHPRGQPARQDRDHRRRRPHRHVRLEYQDHSVVSTEIDMVLGLGFLLTIHDRAWDPRASHHLRNGVGPILTHGPDHLLWAICDDIVDQYFPFADHIGDAIDEVQDEVVHGANPEALERLFLLKRELIEVRRAVGPVREVFNQLTNRETTLIDANEVLYFRDVYDHVIRLTDELDNYRELAAATLDVYLTQVNNNLSVIMKRLTGVTVILAGIGAVGGIFGMSEASNGGGFWVVTGVTIMLAAGAAVVLRRIGWI